MREVLYAKYNSTRRPIYQISTSIVQEDEKKFVIKRAIQPRANEHLRKMVTNRERLTQLYKGVSLVECEMVEDEVISPFVKGCHLMSEVDFVNQSLEDIVVDLKESLKKITSYHDEMMCRFQMTETFAKVFNGCKPEEGEDAICIANVDALLKNFVVSEDGNLYCVAFEWVIDFPVPQKYIVFRNIYHFYQDNKCYLEEMTKQDDFYQMFGYDEEEIELYTKMEQAFQQHIHGTNLEYMYLERYEKDTVMWSEKQNQPTSQMDDYITEIEHLREEVKYWAAVAEEQNGHVVELKRMIKNPLYGIKVVGKKIVQKIKQ